MNIDDVTCNFVEFVPSVLALMGEHQGYWRRKMRSKSFLLVSLCEADEKTWNDGAVLPRGTVTWVACLREMFRTKVGTPLRVGVA